MFKTVCKGGRERERNNFVVFHYNIQMGEAMRRVSFKVFDGQTRT